MKTFLKKIIFFICFIFLLATVIQTAISIRIKGKSITAHDNLDKTSNVNADLVFLGSSRCWVQFDPEFFDTTFELKSVNIGVDGHSEISMALVRLKDYLQRNKPPKFAILNFDPLMHAGSETDNTNYIHKDNFSRYSFLPRNKDILIINYFKFDKAEKYIPLYSILKYKLLSYCILAKDTSSYAKYGYEKHDEQWDTISNPITAETKVHYFTQDSIPSITKSLSELNKLCIKNNIKLICIQTPVYKSIQDDKIFSYPDLICKNISIPFIDVNTPFIRNNINYFYNSDHLNTLGVAQIDTLFKKNLTLHSFLSH